MSSEGPINVVETKQEAAAEAVPNEQNVAVDKVNALEKVPEQIGLDIESKKENVAFSQTNKGEPTIKYNVHKNDFEKDVVYLYQFSRTPTVPSLSPYCLKVETWLRLTGIKYENIDHKMRFRSKKGQLPFVELNGEEIPDSAIIIKELSNKYGKDIDSKLTPEQRNISYAMVAMLENHLIWVIFYWRAKFPDKVLKGYKVNLQHALGLRLPNSILNFFFRITFGRKGSKKLKAHGIGVHSSEEIEEFGKNDLNVLKETLDAKPFFFGEEATILDVVAFAVLSQLYFLSQDVPYSLREYMVEKCPNLVDHVLRMKEKCFPDWDEICGKLNLNAHISTTELQKEEEKPSNEKSNEPNDSDAGNQKVNEPPCEENGEKNEAKEN